MIKEYAMCSCGAITFYTDDGNEYSCVQKSMKAFFPDIDRRRLRRLPALYCCNHCVNHYGLDLCGCGSGELFGDCKNGLPECAFPMQQYGLYSRIVAEDALTN